MARQVTVTRRRLLAALVVLSLPLPSITSCVLQPAEARGLAPAPPTPSPTPLPAIQLPRDEAPHDALSEWWYYTGHLDAADGSHYGFELVIFQAVREGYPVGYAAHFAVTDYSRGSFTLLPATDHPRWPSRAAGSTISRSATGASAARTATTISSPSSRVTG